MGEAITVATAIIAALGVGGIIGAYFQSRFERRAQLSQQEHELKQRRYLCILMLMITKLNPSIGLSKLKLIRPDLGAESDIDHELSTGLLNGVVYASDEVLTALARFIKEPERDAFLGAARAMRQDLWRRRTALGDEFLEITGLFPALAPQPRARRRRRVISRGID